MKNGCLWASGLVVALLAGGCSDAGNPFQPKQKKPVRVTDSTHHATKDSAPTPVTAEANGASEAQANSAGNGDSPTDGSTSAAVLEYLAELEEANARSASSAAKKSPEAEGQAAAVEGMPHVISTAAVQREEGASTVRVNAALEIPQADVSVSHGEVGLALPRVVAVALVGDTSLIAAPYAAATVGAHRGLDVANEPAELSLKRLIEQARQELESDPANAEHQWRLSLLQLADGAPELAAVLSPELPQDARTLIGQWVDVARTASALLADPLGDVEATLVATGTLHDTIRQRAELQIPVVELCSRVETFGVYDKMPVERLVPYQANRVIVYCEVENFTVDAGENGDFRSLLSTRLELFADDGRSVWTHEEESIEDNPKQRREDFFIAQLVTFPADLAPGDYVLKVTVTDTLGSKINQGIRDFTIGGIGSATAKAP